MFFGAISGMKEPLSALMPTVFSNPFICALYFLHNIYAPASTASTASTVLFYLLIFYGKSCGYESGDGGRRMLKELYGAKGRKKSNEF